MLDNSRTPVPIMSFPFVCMIRSRKDRDRDRTRDRDRDRDRHERERNKQERDLSRRGAMKGDAFQAEFMSTMQSVLGGSSPADKRGGMDAEADTSHPGSSRGPKEDSRQATG